ncbi:MAG: hypothetical protein JO014_04340 [Metakosakonia sp.]|nr:hypothetical protein [Phytobacter sp.]MBV8871942.1 hypothetical protein [Phytobacter sp.]
MYSEMIAPKIDKMFNDLRIEIQEVVYETGSLNDTINNIYQRVISETTSRSELMLGDMLFELDRALFNTPFFADNLSRKNEFSSLGLRKEITNKYQFTTTATVKYQEASRIIHAFKIGSGVLIFGGILGLGIIVSSGLELSSLVPIPVSALFAAAIGSAMIDYLFIEPQKSKKRFSSAVDKYLNEAKEQYLNWFDSVENYYNMRVAQIKETIQGM